MTSVPRSKVQRSVKSVEIGGRLLLALAENQSPMSLKDLAARAALSAARAHPYLVSYGKLGLIEQDQISQKYALGPAALEIGLSALNQLDPIRAATPMVETLAATIGQMVIIAVWANFGPTVVRMVQGGEPIYVNMRPGTVMTVFGTATGRAFAASLPAATVELALHRPGGDFTVQRRESKNKLAKELATSAKELRTHGVVRAVGRPIPGVNAFSSPVFNHEGLAVIVITALGHEHTFSSNWDSFEARSVRSTAAELSTRLGFRDVVLEKNRPPPALQS